MRADVEAVRERWANLVAPVICLECDRPVYCRQLCSIHYSRSYKSRASERRPYRRQPATCLSEGCDRPARAGGLCHCHYMAWKRANSAKSTGRPADSTD